MGVLAVTLLIVPFSATVLPKSDQPLGSPKSPFCCKTNPLGSDGQETITLSSRSGHLIVITGYGPLPGLPPRFINSPRVWPPFKSWIALTRFWNCSSGVLPGI